MLTSGYVKSCPFETRRGLVISVVPSPSYRRCSKEREDDIKRHLERPQKLPFICGSSSAECMSKLVFTRFALSRSELKKNIYFKISLETVTQELAEMRSEHETLG